MGKAKRIQESEAHEVDTNQPNKSPYRMAKDPAFLFYTQDFMTGTMFFTDEQVGKYIRLLCAQHQHGRLSEKHMLSICSAYDFEIYSKFKRDEEGMYYNERLEDETVRRKKYTESRKKNAEGKKHMLQHMETENTNTIHSVLDSNGIAKKEPSPGFKKFTDWIDANAQRVGKMKEPFSEDQFNKLMATLSSDAIKDLLLKMHNYEPLHKKSRSAYLTILAWSRKDFNDTKTNRNVPTESVREKKDRELLESVLGPLRQSTTP